jgi:predicted permease
LDIIIFSFTAIAPLFFPMILGWFIKWRKHINEENIDFLNRICFRYLLAFHIFNTTASINFYEEFEPRLVFICSLGIFLVMIAAWAVFSFTIRDREKRCVFIVSSFRSNNIIYAVPMAANLFGLEGVKAAATLSPITIIFFNFFCVIAMVCHAPSNSRDGTPDGGAYGVKAAIKDTGIDILRNPLIAGSLLGILFSLSGVKLPLFIRNGINTVAVAGTPMALILLGAQMDFKQLAGNLAPALGACAVRLVIVPGILAPIMVAAGFRGLELGALMVVFSAPCAVTNLIMARHYGINPPLAAQTVYLSTLLSLPTMFIAISLLRSLGLL